MSSEEWIPLPEQEEIVRKTLPKYSKCIGDAKLEELAYGMEGVIYVLPNGHILKVGIAKIWKNFARTVLLMKTAGDMNIGPKVFAAWKCGPLRFVEMEDVRNGGYIDERTDDWDKQKTKVLTNAVLASAKVAAATGYFFSDLLGNFFYHPVSLRVRIVDWGLAQKTTSEEWDGALPDVSYDEFGFFNKTIYGYETLTEWLEGEHPALVQAMRQKKAGRLPPIPIRVSYDTQRQVRLAMKRGPLLDVECHNYMKEAIYFRDHRQGANGKALLALWRAMTPAQRKKCGRQMRKLGLGIRSLTK